MRSAVLLFLALAITPAVCVTAATAPLSAPPTTPCHADAKWTQPAAPLRVYGNTWYVGTCGLSSILVTSKEGHVLIDGDIEEAAALIEANIRALGFRLEDVRYILHSHEHSDHVGGIAKLQRDSHAVVAARAPAAAALEQGHGDRSDPQFLFGLTFPPIANVRRIDDGEKIRLGPLELTAHATPGHTPGSTTWTWRSCEQRRCLDVVYADSLTAMADDAFHYSDENAHPGVVAAFRRSIATIAALPCDILVTPHPDASDLWERVGAQPKAALIDPGACRRYAAGAAEKLDARIAKEKGMAEKDMTKKGAPP
jgi:metallo-beta-lactamase class B